MVRQVLVDNEDDSVVGHDTEQISNEARIQCPGALCPNNTPYKLERVRLILLWTRVLVLKTRPQHLVRIRYK